VSETPESVKSLPSIDLVDAPPSLVPVALEVQGKTDVGREREHNEDNFLIADLSRGQRGGPDAHGTSVVLGGHGLLFAVCDGMGGAAAGEVASQMAVDVIYQHVVAGLPLEAPLERDAIARRLVRSVEEAGFRIFEAARADRSRRGMGTTVTAAALVDEMLFLAQVGDSRAYVLREERLVQVTRDQSLVNQLIEAGQLTEEEAETFEHNNIILQALGTSDHVQVDLTYAELRAGDRLLLCSDGLSGMVRNEEIRKILVAAATPAEAAQVLIDRANANGGHDNITVIVAFFEGGLRSPSVTDLPLAYRKYVLPEVEEVSTLHGSGVMAAAADALNLSATADRLRSTPRMQTGVFSAIPIPAPSSEPTPREPLPRSILALLVSSVLALVAAIIYSRR
jgi:serine/threonine protein phosphatase PrpC